MASVYKAFQPSVERYVALKILPSQLAQDPEFLGRFRQEAKVLASLQHPHILPVHDFGESDGYTYIVMPFVSTGTLSALMRGQPLPLNQIQRVMSQVGDALDCPHAQGLVHRDVKPSNILLDERGNCLLADFGVAKILEGSQDFTRTGGVVGTPAYVSPEQGLGNKIDSRSDVYSLGVVLYEMATGRAPFKAETPMAVVIKHINDPLPLPRSVSPRLPEAFEAVILKALHKQPSDRYPTAGEMGTALSRASLSAVPSDLVETVILPSSGGEEPTTLPSPLAAAGAPPSPPTDVTVPVASPAGSTPSTTTVRPAPQAGQPAGTRWAAALTVAVLVLLAALWLWRSEAPRTTVPEEIAAGQGPAETAAPDEASPAPAPEPVDAPEAAASVPPTVDGELLISVDAPRVNSTGRRNTSMMRCCDGETETETVRPSRSACDAFARSPASRGAGGATTVLEGDRPGAVE